jgi:hypothetical protein
VEGLLWAVAVDIKQLDVAVARCCYQLLVTRDFELVNLQRQHADVGDGADLLAVPVSQAQQQLPWPAKVLGLCETAATI